MRYSKGAFINVAKFLTINLAFQILFSVISSFYYTFKYGNLLSSKELEVLINKSSYQLTMFAAIFSLFTYYLMLKKENYGLLEICNFKKISLKNSLLVIIASIGFSATSIIVVYLLSDIFKSYENVSNALTTSMESPLILVYVVLLAPIFEEILFRGLVFNEFKKVMNLASSIFLQSFIFALFHGNMLQGIYTFILGIIFGLLYTWTGSMLAPILSHITFNILGTLVLPNLQLNSVIFIVIIGIVLSAISLILIYKDYKKNKEKSYSLYY